MTRPSLLLIVILLMACGSSVARADVSAKDEQAVKFEAASVTEPAKNSEEIDHPELTVRDEIANDKTEGGSCQVVCHPPFTVNSKAHLVKIDVNKIK